MRFRTIVIGVPATVATIVIAIANRHSVQLSFDPFSTAEPALALLMPLYLLLFGIFVLGVLVGGSFAWLGQGRWRKTARQQKRKAYNLERDLAQAPAAQSPETPPDGEAQSKTALPPPS
jgi:uncharacterized integral membrane protein